MSRARLSASRRVTFRVGVAAAALGLPLVAFVATAPAESSSSFSGVASADGLRITTSAPGFLVVEDFIDAGGPTAQAAVSDVEGNRGFASVPYPGELAIAGPGLFAIATGQQFPGHYPFYVASAHPTTPKNGYDAPGLSMPSRRSGLKRTSWAKACISRSQRQIAPLSIAYRRWQRIVVCRWRRFRWHGCCRRQRLHPRSLVRRSRTI